MNKFVSTLALLLICFFSYSQGEPTDSLLVESNPTEKKNSFTSVFYGQPGKAALYSLIMPGAGQLYNKRYWKVPLVWAGEGFVGLYLINSIKTFQRRNECWEAFVTQEGETSLLCAPSRLGISESTSVANSSEAFDLRNSARSQKEVAWIVMGAAHLLNIVEAFVDRHLINFDTSEDLSIHNLPSQAIVKDHSDQTQISLFTIRIGLNSD